MCASACVFGVSCLCVCGCLLPLILFASGPNLLKTSVCWGQVFAVWGVFVQLNNYPDCFAWSSSWRRCCSGHWRPSRTSANQSDREVRTGSRNWGNSQTYNRSITHIFIVLFPPLEMWPKTAVFPFDHLLFYEYLSTQVSIYTRRFLETISVVMEAELSKHSNSHLCCWPMAGSQNLIQLFFTLKIGNYSWCQNRWITLNVGNVDCNPISSRYTTPGRTRQLVSIPWAVADQCCCDVNHSAISFCLSRSPGLHTQRSRKAIKYSCSVMASVWTPQVWYSRDPRPGGPAGS